MAWHLEIRTPEPGHVQHHGRPEVTQPRLNLEALVLVVAMILAGLFVLAWAADDLRIVRLDFFRDGISWDAPAPRGRR